MKLRGMSSSLALLLSLILNAGILLLGIKLYQSQTIALSQVAGSQVSTTVFTMEIIASSPQLESSLKELDLEEVLDVALEEPLEKIFEKDSDNESANSSEDHGEKPVENSLSTIEEEMIVAKKSDREMMMPAKLSDTETVEKIQTEHEKREQAESSKNVVAKSQTSVKENLQKTARKEPIQKQSENQNLSTATQARSGDEFAAELADKIYSQIEGCYPEASKRRGEEGIVRLKIINHHNQLSVEMIQSSGFARLDRCAISAVEKLLKSIDPNIVPVAIEGIELKPIRFQLR